MVILEPTLQNGLTKKSTIDLFQVRSLSKERFVQKIGFVDKEILLKSKKALDIVFEV